MEFLIVILVFVFTFVSGILKSNVHLALIDRLHDLVSNLSLQAECTCCNMKRRLLRIAWENIFTVFVFVSINIYGFVWFEDGSNTHFVILYSLIGWGELSTTLAVLHVKDLCDIVLHLFAHTRKSYLVVDEKNVVNGSRQNSKVNSNFVFGFETLMELHKIKENLSNCFGAQLLFGELKDLLLIATATCYLISLMVYGQIRLSWDMLIYSLIYIILPIMKYGLIIRVFDGMGKQVRKFIFLKMMIINYLYFKVDEMSKIIANIKNSQIKDISVQIVNM